MSKEAKNEKLNEENINQSATADENLDSKVDETKKENCDDADKIDVDKLNDKQAKQMLKEVLEANDELVKELSTAQAESSKHKDSWYRSVAEFENFKKRNQDLRKTAYDDGKIDAIKNMLLIGDSLDRALTMELDEKTKCGVELIQRQFVETMKALGVEAVNPIGLQFTPDEGEAIAMVDALEGEESGVIRNVFKKGYKLNGKTIRYAQVVVVK